MVDDQMSRRAILHFTAGAVCTGVGFSSAIIADSIQKREESLSSQQQDDSGTNNDSLDCQTIGNLRELSSKQLASDPRAITIRGDYAFTTGGGLSIVDISDEAELSEISTLSDETVSGYGHIWIDQYAYLMDMDDSEIPVVDMSDLTNPEVVTRLSDGIVSPRKAAHRNGLLYISSHNDTENFYVVDINDPINPEVAGTVTDPNLRGRCQEVALAGDYAFVTNKDDNVLQSINIEDSSTPQPGDSVALGEPYGMIVLDDHLIVSLTDGTNGIAVLDISNPATIDVVTEQTDNPINSIYGMEYLDGYLYGADKDACHGYHAVNIDTATEPQVTDSVVSENLSKPYDVSIKDGVAFVVSRGSQTIVAIETH